MVTSWFARLAVILAVLAVFAFDGISVVATHFSASDDAQTAAAAAAPLDACVSELRNPLHPPIMR